MDTYGAAAEDNNPVMVQATVTSVHDRLPPYEGHNIVVEEHYTFRLTGGSKVEEEWRNRPVATESGAIDIGGFLWGWKLCTQRGWPACSMEGPRRSSELRWRAGNACKRAPAGQSTARRDGKEMLKSLRFLMK